MSDSLSDAEKVLARLDEISTSFGSRFETMTTRLDKLEKRADEDKREEEKHEDDKKRDDMMRDARRARHDAFKHYSDRRDDDDDDKFKARHDEEENWLVERLEKEGEPRETAADRAKKGRRDAEHCADDAKFFSKRRDDDDDDKFKGRRDAEEKELAERLEKEGETKEDAALRAHWARGRRDDNDKRRADDDKKRDDKKRDDKSRDDDDKKRDDKKMRDDAAELEKRLRASILKELRPEITDDDRVEITDAQTRADQIYSAFGEQAPRPVPGELAVAYLRRAFNKYKQYSPAWKDVDLTELPKKALNAACNQIRSDAIEASRQSATFPGVLRAVEKRDDTGRKITEFVGDPITWMASFMPPQRFVTKFNTSRQQ